MGTHWLDIQSFQHGQELLSAVNTLSIHSKLTGGGYPDTGRIEAAEQARETLIGFIEKLGEIAQNIEDGSRKPLLGVDVRLRHLAENYVQARRSQLGSSFRELSLSQVRELFYSERAEERRELLNVLAVFRDLLEEHVSVDATRLLGDF